MNRHLSLPHTFFWNKDVRAEKGRHECWTHIILSVSCLLWRCYKNTTNAYVWFQTKLPYLCNICVSLWTQMNLLNFRLSLKHLSCPCSRLCTSHVLFACSPGSRLTKNAFKGHYVWHRFPKNKATVCWNYIYIYIHIQEELQFQEVNALLQLQRVLLERCTVNDLLLKMKLK